MEFIDEPPLNITYLEYSQYCYDATWTLAYALNKTLDSKYQSFQFQSFVSYSFATENAHRFDYDNFVVELKY
jgi:hypothetical protein